MPDFSKARDPLDMMTVPARDTMGVLAREYAAEMAVAKTDARLCSRKLRRLIAECEHILCHLDEGADRVAALDLRIAIEEAKR